MFRILSDLIAPLKDGHIGLAARIGGERHLFEPNPGALVTRIRAEAQAARQAPDAADIAFREAYWQDHIQTCVLAGGGVMTGSEYIQYGMAAPRVGYINFLTMVGYATGELDTLEDDITALHSIMDAAIATFEAAGADHVIVDLSLNFGGYDEVALAVASRFTAHPVFAMAEYPADARTPITLRRNVTPHAGTTFTGPLTLITSDMTVSAGEILTLALRALPQTTHVGEATRGAFSDVLEKELPNGWRVELSNEVYSDHRGIVWEGRGVRPSHSVPVFEGADPLKAHGVAIARVLSMR